MEVNGIIINPQNGNAGVNTIDFSITSVNEGIDKEILIDGVCGDKSDTLIIRHEGLRQQFRFNDGRVLRMANGGRFGVLKSNTNPSLLYEEIE